MKFVALISGGKDSIYTILECVRNGHELIACAHLSPRRESAESSGEEEESYMYQSAASECIQILVEECIGVPLVIRTCRGRSSDTSLIYDHNKKECDENDDNVVDEVEDMYALLKQVKSLYPKVEAISSGAILSTYQRTRIESVCGRLGFTSLGYLWRISTQRKLLECMLEDGLEAVLVKVASPPGLIPRKHLNKTLGTLHYGGVFDRLKDKFDFHICGEGGEYETLVLDCPLYRKRLELTEVDIIETDDGVGILSVINCRSIDKEDHDDSWKYGNTLCQRLSNTDDIEKEYNDPNTPQCENIPSKEEEESTNEGIIAEMISTVTSTHLLPHVKILPGGLAHISQILCQDSIDRSILNLTDDEIESEVAVMEATQIFNLLKVTLSSIDWDGGVISQKPSKSGATAQDVVYVHLYLSSMNLFNRINGHYKDFFGTIMPPSRSCVAVGKGTMPEGRHVMMDCLIQRGSGTYMRIESEHIVNESPRDWNSDFNFIRQHKSNPHHVLRSNLHVQTISHWAPVTVGPYSQANTLRSGIIFVAGQIGLIPSTMKIYHGGWQEELSQCWRNAAAVLDALEGSLNDVMAGLVYVSSGLQVCATERSLWDQLNTISRKAMKENGGVLSITDANNPSSDQYNGYEDYETWKELSSANENQEELESDNPSEEIPILMVAIPEMPVGAKVEVEIISATSRASSCLDMKTSIRSSFLCQDLEDDQSWNLGYDYSPSVNKSSSLDAENVAISTVMRRIGSGCMSVAYVTANVKNSSIISLDNTFEDMISSAIESIEEESELHRSKILHIRLFYISSLFRMTNINTALQSSIWSQFYRKKGKRRSAPAFTCVPVSEIFMSQSSDKRAENVPTLFGMQIITADLVHMETELWVHNR